MNKTYYSQLFLHTLGRIHYQFYTFKNSFNSSVNFKVWSERLDHLVDRPTTDIFYAKKLAYWNFNIIIGYIDA